LSLTETAQADTLRSQATTLKVIASKPPPVELCTVSATDSEIKKAARTMAGGDWKKLAVTYDAPSERDFFYSSPYLGPVNQSTQHLDWANSAGWDPYTRCFYFYGAGHLVQPAFIRLCENTMKWTYEVRPTAINYTDSNVWTWAMHAYSTNAMDTDKGIHYLIRFGSLYAYDTRSGVWTLDPGSSRNASQYWGTRAIGYFKGMGLVEATTDDATVALYNDQTKTWTTLASNLANFASGYATARYNPASNVMIFGSTAGSSLYKLTADRKVSSIPTPPVAFTINTGSGWFTEDPSGGNFIFLDKTGAIYQYDPTTNAWAAHGTSPLNAGGAGITTSIPEYGVIAYYVYGSGLWLYKANGSKCP